MQIMRNIKTIKMCFTLILTLQCKGSLDNFDSRLLPEVALFSPFDVFNIILLFFINIL